VRPIGTKWVLKNKKDERGIVIRNKARLVAQGHTQEEGIDYDEVFAPVARIEAIRLFLSCASFMGFTVYQMDVKSAFLYGTIYEEVYVMQPPRFQDLEYPARVYKVEKAMVTNQAETPSLDNILTLSNQFEDILGVTTNSKESSRVEADVSNMETTITTSPTLTLRIHRDHPKSQIIGPVDTLI
nr:copia protein [Tanacetum cinerariifolium]